MERWAVIWHVSKYGGANVQVSYTCNLEHVETRSLTKWQVGSWQLKRKALSRYNKINAVWFLKVQNKWENSHTGQTIPLPEKEKKVGLTLRLSHSWLWGTGDLIIGGVLGCSTIPFIKDWGISRDVGILVFTPGQPQVGSNGWKPRVCFHIFHLI